MATEPKLKDPTEAALSAIEEALSMAPAPRPWRLWKGFGDQTGRMSLRSAPGTSPRRDARVLDLVHLERQTFGDRRLEREVLALFEDQCDRLLPLMAAADPISARTDAAHTLKGAARAIGAWRVASLSETLETALDQGRSAETLRHLERKLAKALAEARAAIAERCRSAAA